MPACGAPCAADQPAAAQGAQHLMQIGFGHVLPRGDLAALDGSFAEVQRQLEERPNPVISAT